MIQVTQLDLFTDILFENNSWRLATMRSPIARRT